MLPETQNAITWINTLLTTNAKQDKCRLGGPRTGFCCLGLGCYTLGIKYNTSDVASMQFKDAVGLKQVEGQINYNGLDEKESQEALSYLNDHLNKSFVEIAHIILQNPDKYFYAQVAQGLKAHFQPQPKQKEALNDWAAIAG